MQYKNVVKDIQVEIVRIEKLINNYQPLLEKVIIQEPNFIELGSLAILL